MFDTTVVSPGKIIGPSYQVVPTCPVDLGKFGFMVHTAQDDIYSARVNQCTCIMSAKSKCCRRDSAGGTLLKNAFYLYKHERCNAFLTLTSLPAVQASVEFRFPGWVMINDKPCDRGYVGTVCNCSYIYSYILCTPRSLSLPT